MSNQDPPSPGDSTTIPYLPEAGKATSLRFGVSLTQDSAQELTGQKIDPEIFDLQPTGNLIFCCIEQTPEDYGLIKMVTQYKEPPGCGYIIAAGPFAGQDPQTQGVSAIGIVGRPEELLGLHVIFGAHSGVPIRVNLTEGRYNGQVFMMPSKDIQAIDLNSKPLGDRIQERILKRGKAEFDSSTVTLS